MEKTEEEEEEEKEPKELPYLFEKELIEKSNKKIIILGEYIPTGKVPPLTYKYYSKYERDSLPLTANGRDYMAVATRFAREPTEKYEAPLLESHRYGWLPRLMDTKDALEMNPIVAPKRRCDLTIFGETLFCSRITQRPKFGGLRFFVR